MPSPHAPNLAKQRRSDEHHTPTKHLQFGAASFMARAWPGLIWAAPFKERPNGEVPTTRAGQAVQSEVNSP